MHGEHRRHGQTGLVRGLLPLCDGGQILAVPRLDGIAPHYTVVELDPIPVGPHTRDSPVANTA
jgi:hypothetical protein